MSNVYEPVNTSSDDTNHDNIIVKKQIDNDFTDINNSEVSSDDDDPYLTLCGVGSWRPTWLQVFASPTWFTINFALVGIIQSMTGTYLIASLSTLEKRFAFDSKIAGFILIADNFMEMLVSPIVGYLGNRYHRPRMIATGELILALSCLINAMPYFIYGAGTHLLHDDNILTSLLPVNGTRYEMCPINHNDIDCSTGKHSTVWTAVIILLIGSSFRGLGYTAYWVIGMPYIDDSVSKENSPMYFSFLTSLRLIGPAGGFLMSSLSLRFYENPFYDPGITRRDPRFIGAWWIGFIIIGSLLLLFSLPMFLFPKQLKTSTVKAKDLKDNITGLRGMVDGVKRLARNPIFMFHMVGGAFRYIGLGGYYISKPKYVESQFRQTSSGASFITGTTSILPMAIGIIVGGVMIKYIKPRPLILVIYMFVVEWFYNGAVLIAMFLGCPPIRLPSTSHTIDNRFSMLADCNRGCDCTTSVFTPICSADQKTTYFSPCYAGCHSINRVMGTVSGCSCLSGVGGTATTGYCPIDSDDCNKLMPYLIVLTMGAIISSTARTGNTILSLRVIDPKDKGFAFGIIGTFLAIFAFIPYPLIFGAVVDSTCMVWEEKCGKQGNCWIYDQDKFRYYLHGTCLAFICIGSLFDLGIIYNARSIKNFYGDESDDDKSDQNNKNKIDPVDEKFDINSNHDIYMTTTVPMVKSDDPGNDLNESITIEKSVV